MKRADLKPGVVFRYLGETYKGLFWVRDTKSPKPPGTIVSIGAPGDMDLDVEIVSLPEPNLSEKPPRPQQPHYTALDPEPIDVIDAWDLNFRLGNALKYIARAGRKLPADVRSAGSEDARGVRDERDRLAREAAASDLRKAVTYIEREIAALEGRRAWK